jgi:hypothetical protein
MIHLVAAPGCSTHLFYSSPTNMNAQGSNNKDLLYGAAICPQTDKKHVFLLLLSPSKHAALQAEEGALCHTGDPYHP